MPQKTYTPAHIINKLREAEVLLSQGASLAVIWKKIGVSDCTYYRWRKEYGGMRVDQAQRLKELEQENSRHDLRCAARDTAGLLYASATGMLLCTI